MSEITEKQIKGYRENFEKDKLAKIAQNAVTNVPLPKLTLNREIVNELIPTFSIKLDDWAVTNQKRSGRCWLFAALNLFRVGAMKKMNLKILNLVNHIFIFGINLKDLITY